MTKRINVILPEETVRTIDRMARPGQRSRFIQSAVQHYVATASPEALQERLRQAVLRDRDLDLEIANDWFAVDQEVDALVMLQVEQAIRVAFGLP